MNESKTELFIYKNQILHVAYKVCDLKTFRAEGKLEYMAQLYICLLYTSRCV